MYILKVSNESGRGLYAVRDIKAGTILDLCELLVLDAQDTKSVNETALQFYTFKYNETQDCLVLGNGEIYNHNENANVGYELERIHPHEPRLGMQFVTLRDVVQGEELCINYAADVNVDTSNYLTSKSLVG